MLPTSRWRFHCWAWLAIVLSSVSFALGGTSIVMPGTVGTTTTVFRSGLTLTIKSDWPDGRGYRPVTITVSSALPLKSDRQLNMELEVCDQRGLQNRSVKTPFDMELPAGSVSTSKLITVPEFLPTQSLFLEVWENGRKQDDLCFKYAQISRPINGSWSELPNMLFIGPDEPDISELRLLGSVPPAGNNPIINSTTGQVEESLSLRNVASFAAVSRKDLPEDWLNYTNLDVICLALDEAQALSTESPDVWKAIRLWTSAGGNLIVHGVGSDWHGLETVSSLLRLPAAADGDGSALAGWKQPDKELYGQVLDSVQFDEDGFMTPKAKSSKRKKAPRGAAPEVAPFVWRDAMLGKVLAIADDEVFPGDVEEWGWIFNTLGPENWKWRLRHGIWSDFGNEDFDDLLIANIGLPPVRTYRVLITVFVLAIGPLNYWLLYRKQRLHLLLFTVPAAALVISAALLGYATVADGFGTQLRSRSMTRLDQRSDQAATWARHSYYAGLAPSHGMKFPTDTAVLPLERRDSLSRQTRTINWDEGQNLERGWLRSRMSTQFLIVRPYFTRRELVVTEADADKSCHVENRLGTSITHLIVCDSSGVFHYGKAIGNGGKADLKRLDTVPEGASMPAETTEFVARLMADPPMMPPDLDMNRDFNRNFSSPMYLPMQTSYAGNLTNNSLLERELKRVQREVSDHTLAPRSYVAIVERSAELPIGVDQPSESQSLHVIHGAW